MVFQGVNSGEIKSDTRR